MNINEIAAMAGVSRTTVSRALNGGYVSESARSRIEAVIRETGYVASSQARAFRTKKSSLIGIIVIALDSELVMCMANSLLEIFENAGFQTILMRHLESDAKLVAQARQLKARGVDGLIVFTLDNSSDVEQALVGLNIPVVTIGPVSFPSLPGICHDDYEAFTLLTQTAVEHGYHRIGMMFPHTANGIHRVRKQAIIDVLQNHGLEMNPAYFFFGSEDSATHLQLGEELGNRFLQSTDRPELLIAATDAIAIGAYRVFMKAGLRIPQDVALMGSGNTTLGQLMVPSLTTVENNRLEITDKAASLLLDIIDKKEKEAKKIHIKPLLLLRDSI